MSDHSEDVNFEEIRKCKQDLEKFEERKQKMEDEKQQLDIQDDPQNQLKQEVDDSQPMEVEKPPKVAEVEENKLKNQDDSNVSSKHEPETDKAVSLQEENQNKEEDNDDKDDKKDNEDEPEVKEDISEGKEDELMKSNQSQIQELEDELKVNDDIVDDIDMGIDLDIPKLDNNGISSNPDHFMNPLDEQIGDNDRKKEDPRSIGDNLMLLDDGGLNLEDDDDLFKRSNSFDH